MANYYATARSNYFAVKDEEAFRQWAKSRHLEVITPDHKHDGTLFGVYPADWHCDNGSWPSEDYNEVTDEFTEYNLAEELSSHIADDHVAILLEIGNEKLRYLTGQAVAINNKGKSVGVNIDDIYERAKLLGSKITRAEY